MDIITDNLAQSLVIVGLLLLAIEILMLGFATFILFFIGVASVITGILVGIGIIDHNLVDALLVVGVLSAVTAALSWKPLKMMQDNVTPTQVTNDMIGDHFLLPEDLSPGHPIKCRYSGIEWSVSSDEKIMLGLEVEITDVSVGHLRVKPCS
ncbi:NfeD family protein [Psychrobium sp. nBUS_13]|uniref:NfeD family protein n=1 Tax=Psychrobium sp. nBUS_13 TaxID=3395319 RepID=UPI003EB94BBA